jgi:drug/metabolite transporter (DMT)-like permease
VSRRGWVLFALVSVIWGIPYLLIKVADGEVSVPVLVLVRVVIAAALLLPVALRRREVAAVVSRWRWVLLFALVEIIMPWALLSDAEHHLSSSMSGLLVAAAPIVGVVTARLTGGAERLTVLRWLGLLAGVAGVALLGGPGALGGSAWPVAEVLLVAVGYSIGPLIVSRKLDDLPELGVIAVSLALTAVVYAPAAAMTWPSVMPSLAVIGALAGLGALATALGFVLFFKLIAEAGPARSLVITYVNPAVAVALGVWVLGEPLTPEILMAFPLILAGSVLATRSGGPARRQGAARPRAVPAGGGTHQPAGGGGTDTDGVAAGGRVATGEHVGTGERVAAVERVGAGEHVGTGGHVGSGGHVGAADHVSAAEHDVCVVGGAADAAAVATGPHYTHVRDRSQGRASGPSGLPRGAAPPRRGRGLRRAACRGQPVAGAHRTGGVPACRAEAIVQGRSAKPGAAR